MTQSPLIHDVELFLNDKPAVYALREKAKKALNLCGFPSKKSEAWKYTDVSSILNTNYIINTSEPCGHDCCSHNKEDTSPFIEIKFCHGKLHIEEYNTPEGLTITPLPLALFEGEYKQYIFNSFDLEKHPFSALNGLYLEQGICIHVEKNTSITKPILIKYNTSHCENLQINIHNIFILEKNSLLNIVEQYTSNTATNHLTNVTNEIYIKQNALLTHYKIQKEDSLANHIALNAIKIQNSGTYKQYYLSNGAKLSRQETIVNLEQPNATTEIYSAYTAKNNTLNDITTNIYHHSANTCSNQYAKGVLEDDSTAVFQGKIYIAPNAFKSTGNQLHKALYLNDNATLNCKPELEIYADDVKCSHGASCGEINKDHIFYLTSRGISKKQAIQMLTNAHLEEIISLITNQEIKELFSN